MPSPSTWPPELDSPLCVRQGKSLPTDWRVLCSLHGVQEQSPQTLSGPLSALIFLACRLLKLHECSWKGEVKHPPAFWQVSEIFVLGTMNLRAIFCWHPSSLPELFSLTSDIDIPPHIQRLFSGYFWKPHASSLWSAQEFCDTVPSHLRRDLPASWLIFGWQRLPHLRCLPSLFGFPSSLSRLALLFHLPA